MFQYYFKEPIHASATSLIQLCFSLLLHKQSNIQQHTFSLLIISLASNLHNPALNIQLEGPNNVGEKLEMGVEGDEIFTNV